MAWAGAAATRREFSGTVRVAAPAAAAVTADAVPMPNPVVEPPLVRAPLVAASIIDDFQNYISGISGDVKLWLWNNVAQPPISAAVNFFIRQYVPDLAPVAARVVPIVVSGVGDWIFRGTVSQEVDQLVSDPDVSQAVSTLIAHQITATGVSAEAGAAIGNAAVTWVHFAFSGEQGEPVRQVFDTLLNNLPGLPSGWDVARLLWEFTFNGYTFKQLVEDQLGTPLQMGISNFLGDARVQLALSNATAGAVSVLLGNTGPWWDPANRSVGIPALAGEGLGGLVATALLGDRPEAADVRQRIGDVVSRLLNNPALGDTAAGTARTTLSTLLAQPAVRDAVAISAANALRAFLGVPQAPVPTLQDAVGTTVTSSVRTLLADTRVIAAVGRSFRDGFAGVMSNPAVRALIGAFVAAPLGRDTGQAVSELLGTPAFRDGLASALGGIPMNLLGSEQVRAALAVVFGQVAHDLTAGVPIGDALGPAVNVLLNDTAVRRALGSTAAQLAIDVTDVLARWAGTVIQEPTARALVTYVGTAINGFLEYPGMNAVLTDTVDGVVNSAIDGTDASIALYALATNSTYRSALGATIPGLVNSVFGDAGIRQAAGQLASVAVVNLMRSGGVDIPILNAALGQAAYAAVNSLLADTSVAQLVSTLGIGALSAVPSNELIDTALHAVLTEFGLQAAIGFALGRGVGALFGDNIFAMALGEVTGAAATLVVATVAGITRLFVGDFAPPPVASVNTGHFFVTLPVSGDLYVTGANA